MPQRFYKQASRSDWYRDTAGTENLRNDEVQLGAILRIADATEAMARRYTDLIDSRDYLKREVNRLNARLETERRRVAALRGVIRRRKGK